MKLRDRYIIVEIEIDQYKGVFNLVSVTGLEGVNIAETELGLVDGENGRLVYRGYWAKELALSHDYEAVVYLLLYGKLPNEEELASFKNTMASKRTMPEYVKQIIDLLPADMDMMSVLRTAVSAMGTSNYQWEPTIDQALDIVAVLPTMIAYRYHKIANRSIIEPDPARGHVENYLYMLSGTQPNPAHIRALNAYFVLTIEHGMNASTFTARTVISSQSELISSVTGAIGTMKGPLHGGAPTEVMQLLDGIGTKENAETYMRSLLEKGERLMGFGHRVYKTHDPRTLALREVCQELDGEDPWLDLAVYVENKAVELLEEYKPGRRLYTNVEFYAAALFRAIDLPRELFVSTFTASRVAGWCAHALEQVPANRIYRPRSTYTGPMPE